MKGLRRREWANGQVSGSGSASALSAITTTSVNSPLSLLIPPGKEREGKRERGRAARTGSDI